MSALGWVGWRQLKQKKLDQALSSYSARPFAKDAKANDFFAEPHEDNYGLELAGSDNIFASDFAAGDFDVIDMDQGEIESFFYKV